MFTALALLAFGWLAMLVLKSSNSGCPGDDAGPDAARTRPALVEADRGLMTALMVSLLDLAFHAAFLVWLVTLLTYAAARLWAEIID